MNEEKNEVIIKNKKIDTIASFINWVKGLYLLTGVIIGFSVASKLAVDFWQGIASVVIYAFMWLPMWLVNIIVPILLP